MSEVAFHFNAPDKLGYACRLLRKAYLKGARLVVWAAPADRQALSQALWNTPGFVPHGRDGDAPHVRAHSPILITSEHPVTAPFDAQVLVNLTDQMPTAFEPYARVIEVVSLDEADRLRARERWRQYREQGHEPQRHDLQLNPA